MPAGSPARGSFQAATNGSCWGPFAPDYANPRFRKHRLPDVLELFAELAAGSASENCCRGALRETLLPVKLRM
jgi:hypothetical protein